jgi:hypothetical protein
MGQNNAVENLSSFDKAQLFLLDKGWKERIEVVSNTFGNYFIDKIAESDWSKFVRIFNLILFGDKCKKGRVEVWEDLEEFRGIFKNFHHILFYQIPTSMKTIGCKTIRSGRFTFRNFHNF